MSKKFKKISHLVDLVEEPEQVDEEVSKYAIEKD